MTEKERKYSEKKHWLILSGIIFLGAALRFYRLDHFSLWYDEVFNLIQAVELKRFFADLSGASGAPLYPVLISAWIKIFGQSVYSLRFMPAFLSVLSIPLLYLIASALYGRQAGLLSAFLLGINPWHVWYAQEAVLYGPSVFICLLLWYCFLLYKANKLPLLPVLLTGAAALSLNYFSLFFIGFMIGSRALPKKKQETIVFSVFAAAYILFSVLLIPAQTAGIKACFWAQPPQAIDIFNVFNNFISGYNADRVIYFLSISLFVLIMAVWVLKEKKAEDFYLLAAIIFLPLIAVFLISRQVSVFTPKVFIIFSGFFYLIAARVMDRHFPKKIRVLVLSVIVLINSAALANYYQGRMPLSEKFNKGVQQKADFKNTVSLMRKELDPADYVFHTNFHTLIPFLYYFQDNKDVEQVYAAHPAAQQDRYWKNKVVIGRKKTKRSRKNFDHYIIDISNREEFYEFNRIWLICSGWRLDGSLDQHSQAVLEVLKNRFEQSMSFTIDNLRIHVFEQTPEI